MTQRSARSLIISMMAGVLLFVNEAGATLIFDGLQDLTGTGLGAVNTVLTIQSPESSTDPTGCVGRIGGCPGGSLNTTPSDLLRVIGGSLGGNELTGDSQTKTIPGSTLVSNSAGDLRIVFNPSEPDTEGGQSITIEDLRVTIYNADGSVQFSSGELPAAVPFPSATGGVGQAGFFFRLDTAQAGAAGTIAADDRIGLSSSLSNAHGDPETFFVTAVTDGTSGEPGVIPEPATLLLVGSGLAGVAACRRWRLLLLTSPSD
jgi:PEP-CTERM motif-containing protein